MGRDVENIHQPVEVDVARGSELEGEHAIPIRPPADRPRLTRGTGGSDRDRRDSGADGATGGDRHPDVRGIEASRCHLDPRGSDLK